MSAADTLTKYDGHCHCGRFRFKLNIPKITSVTRCECSYCVKNGITWKFPIPKTGFEIQSGHGSLTKYQFGAKKNEHWFCPECGSYTMTFDTKDQVWGVNVRMIENLEWESLESDEFEGATKPPLYQPPPFPSASSLSELEPGKAIYNGNCHCKAVRFTVKTETLDTQEVMSCNCSLCSRNGDHFIYPPTSSVVVEGRDNLTDYAFLNEKTLHSFCKICGVSVLIKIFEEGVDMLPLNVRTFHGIELSKLRYKKYDGASNKPLYKGTRHEHRKEDL